MKPTISIITLLFLAALLSRCKTSEKTIAPSLQPNFFLFLADDLGLDDLGVTGNPHVATPTIDEFARASVSFTHMYTPSAMCAPARSALYTGLYPHRNGCHMNHGQVKPGVGSLPTYLQAVGYRVALVGKRHIKPAVAFPFDYLKPDELANYLSADDGPVCVIYASDEPHGPHLKNAHDPDKVIVPAKWIDTKKTRNMLAGYYADISLLDQEYAAFLATTEAYRNNAVTIFTSDHGFNYFAKWSCYEAGLRVPFYLQLNGPSAKQKEVDALTNFVDIVPTFRELAGEKAEESNRMLKIIKGEAAGAKLDGKSMVGLLKGKQKDHHEFIYGAHTTRGIYSGFAYPVRSITDGRWKYIRNLNFTDKFQNIITNGWNFDPVGTDGSWSEWLSVLEAEGAGARWATMYQVRPYEEFYDLNTDPQELNNLADKAETLKWQEQLSQQLDVWMKEQGDTGMEAENAVPLKAKDPTKVPKE